MMVVQRINLDEIECKENYTELSTFHPNREDVNIENEHQSNDQQESDLHTMSDNSFKYDVQPRSGMNYSTSVLQSNYKIHKGTSLREFLWRSMR